MIENRPLSSVVAVKLLGDAFEFSAVIVAPYRLTGIVFHGAADASGRRAVQPAPEPMTAGTIFDLASLTKVVATTTSVMQLVERGDLRLNDRVTQFIPEFGKNDKNAITIRHLLTHTSGLAPDLPL